MTFKIASCLLGIYTNTSCLGQAGSKLSGRVRAACTAAWDFSQRACQLLMNSHSVLSSFPPLWGPGTAVCKNLSVCVKRKQSAVEVQRASLPAEGCRSVSFPASECFRDRFLSCKRVTKNKGNVRLSVGQGI